MSPQQPEIGNEREDLPNSNRENIPSSNHEPAELDLFEPVERPSIFHRESFLVQFTSKEGPRAILVLIVFLALGSGSTVGVVPAVMTDRYARLNHDYRDEMNCADYEMAWKPQACLDGSADAQNASALGNLVSNVLTFASSSLMGSLSDEHGRRGTTV